MYAGLNYATETIAHEHMRCHAPAPRHTEQASAHQVSVHIAVQRAQRFSYIFARKSGLRACKRHILSRFIGSKTDVPAPMNTPVFCVALWSLGRLPHQLSWTEIILQTLQHDSDSVASVLALAA